MKELSLHVLDIVQNSIRAGARKVEIKVKEQLSENLLVIEIEDDGRGMDPTQKKEAVDPFCTSRDTRDVGLGLALFKQAAEACDGHLEIDSRQGQGTKVKAVFVHDHIDRAPMGDMPGTLVSIIGLNKELEISYEHEVEEQIFKFSTEEIKSELGAVKITEPKILKWLEEYLAQEITSLAGGE